MSVSREDALFARALEKSAVERAPFLERECAGDAGLLDENQLSTMGRLHLSIIVGQAGAPVQMNDQ